MTPSEIPELAALFWSATSVIVLTGAGISTESGIPDFRSPGGLYESIDPMEYLSIEALEEHPKRFWRYFIDAFASTTQAEPNAGHKALAALEHAGWINGIITQNIDGLHSKAGSRQVYEVHGHLRTVHCYKSGHTHPLSLAVEQMNAGALPHCPACGAALRPDVVLFGDAMPAAFQKALAAADEADLTLVVGSSLMVTPANYLALDAHQLAIINRDPTIYDARADVVIHSNAGNALTALAEELLQPDA